MEQEKKDLLEALASCNTSNQWSMLDAVARKVSSSDPRAGRKLVRFPIVSRHAPTYEPAPRKSRTVWPDIYRSVDTGAR